MFEICDECKSAIINKKCSECNDFYSCYICDFVEERYQQGRADAIDEVKNKMFSMPTSISAYDVIRMLYKLKEQNK